MTQSIIIIIFTASFVAGALSSSGYMYLIIIQYTQFVQLIKTWFKLNSMIVDPYQDDRIESLIHCFVSFLCLSDVWETRSHKIIELMGVIELQIYT